MKERVERATGEVIGRKSVEVMRKGMKLEETSEEGE